jgi:single-strand DNA-binding protein
MANPTITIIGNLAQDPDIKFTQSGKAVVKFTVVTSRSIKNDDGSWESKDTTFWNVSAWDKLAENIADSLMKGDEAIVSGIAYTAEWEDKATGEKRSRIEVTANSVGVGLKRYPAQVKRTATSSGPSDHGWGAASAEADPWSAPF